MIVFNDNKNSAKYLYRLINANFLSPAARILAMRLITSALENNETKCRVYVLSAELGIGVNTTYKGLRELVGKGIIKLDLKHKSAEIQPLSNWRAKNEI